MSSILKALHRVETGPDSDTSPLPGEPLPWAAPSPRSKAPWAERIWEWAVLKGRRFGIALLVLAATTAAILVATSFWPAFPEKGERTPSPSPRTERKPEKPLQPKIDTGLTVGKKKQASPAGHLAGRIEIPPAPSAAPAPLRGRPPIAHDGAAKSPSGTNAAPEAGNEPKDEKPLPSRPLTMAGAAPALPAEAGLRLQAISWSPTAEKRIAVINDKVLHIGNAIDGYTIREIEPDFVGLLRNGEFHKLIFVAR